MKAKRVTTAELLNLRATGSQKELARQVRTMAHRINERFRYLEKTADIRKNTAYKYAQSELGKEKPRYTESMNMLEKMSKTELYQLALDINRKLESKTSTKSGLKEIEHNRIEGLKESDVVKELDKNYKDLISGNEEEFKKFLKDYGADIIGKNISSDVLFEYFALKMEKGLDNRTFRKIYQHFEKQQKQDDLGRFDTSGLMRTLKNIK